MISYTLTTTSCYFANIISWEEGDCGSLAVASIAASEEDTWIGVSLPAEEFFAFCIVYGGPPSFAAAKTAVTLPEFFCGMSMLAVREEMAPCT